MYCSACRTQPMGGADGHTIVLVPERSVLCYMWETSSVTYRMGYVITLRQPVSLAQSCSGSSPSCFQAGIATASEHRRCIVAIRMVGNAEWSRMVKQLASSRIAEVVTCELPCSRCPREMACGIRGACGDIRGECCQRLWSIDFAPYRVYHAIATWTNTRAGLAEAGCTPASLPLPPAADTGKT